MSNVMKSFAVVILTCLMSTSVQAAFLLNGTRFIYQGAQNSLSATVRNESKLTYGGQVWITTSVKSSEQTTFIPTPTFFKLAAGQSQVIRILGIQTEALATDRESLFWLNVQEIPPAPKSGGNTISIAMNTQVKLIYRPETLLSGRENAEKKLKFTAQANGLAIENPTPYYIAISALRSGDERVVLSAASDKALATLAPFSRTIISEKVALKSLNVDALDDHGATRTFSPEAYP